MVDSSSLIYRAFYSTSEMRSPDGTPINAAHGFLNMLARLVTDRHPTYMACATDRNWRPQWRVDLIESYKTHRVGTPESTIVDDQMPIIFEILGRLGVAVVGVDDQEAEDVIGALVTMSRGRVEIVSGDRDLFQLVRDPDVVVLYPKRGVSELLVVDEAYIETKYGIPGKKYGDFALLRGDPSDGLPGVVGIGEKTASSLISKYGSIEGVIGAALVDTTSSALLKVRRALDYLDRAANVVLISGDLAVGDVDMTLPREIDEAALESARGYGLEGALRRLVRALTGERSPEG
ncbi:MAG TPA: 5'-3' exonuclease [Actinomycetota bacterium]|nr:5'-3' exonuclease [Actinomycetota bacterium]